MTTLFSQLRVHFSKDVLDFLADHALPACYDPATRPGTRDSINKWLVGALTDLEEQWPAHGRNPESDPVWAKHNVAKAWMEQW